MSKNDRINYNVCNRNNSKKIIVKWWCIFLLNLCLWYQNFFVLCVDHLLVGAIKYWNWNSSLNVFNNVRVFTRKLPGLLKCACDHCAIIQLVNTTTLEPVSERLIPWLGFINWGSLVSRQFFSRTFFLLLINESHWQLVCLILLFTLLSSYIRHRT